MESFLDVADNLRTAGKQGKRFAVHVAVEGLPLSQGNSFLNFAQPHIADYIKANFEVT